MYVWYDYDEVIKTLYAGRTLASLTKSNAIKEQCSERFWVIILSSELLLNIDLSDKQSAGKLKKTLQKNNSCELFGEEREGNFQKANQGDAPNIKLCVTKIILLCWRKGCVSFEIEPM